MPYIYAQFQSQQYDSEVMNYTTLRCDQSLLAALAHVFIVILRLSHSHSQVTMKVVQYSCWPYGEQTGISELFTY